MKLTQKHIDYFDNLKPLTDVEHIPDLPPVNDWDEYNKIIVSNLIRCGAIPKCKLQIGKTYLGKCRHNTEATWDGEKFLYKRYKFKQWFDDKIKHFEDDKDFDVFIPIKEKK